MSDPTDVPGVSLVNTLNCVAGIVFGASSTSVVASYDKGSTWREVAKLKPTDGACGLDGCLECHNPAGGKYADLCVECAPGFTVKGNGAFGRVRGATPLFYFLMGSFFASSFAVWPSVE